MRKTVSSKQLAANRANAGKSTGPRTEAGRAASKMNALKHGILSKEVLVQGFYRDESSQELTALHERFWQDLDPIGPVEEMLVDQIVTAQWRLRRALTAESGEIALRLHGGSFHCTGAIQQQLRWAQWNAGGDPVAQMQESAFGNQPPPPGRRLIV